MRGRAGTCACGGFDEGLSFSFSFSFQGRKQVGVSGTVRDPTGVHSGKKNPPSEGQLDKGRTWPSATWCRTKGIRETRGEDAEASAPDEKSRHKPDGVRAREASTNCLYNSAPGTDLLSRLKCQNVETGPRGRHRVFGTCFPGQTLPSASFMFSLITNAPALWDCSPIPLSAPAALPGLHPDGLKAELSVSGGLFPRPQAHRGLFARSAYLGRACSKSPGLPESSPGRPGRAQLGSYGEPVPPQNKLPNTSLWTGDRAFPLFVRGGWGPRFPGGAKPSCTTSSLTCPCGRQDLRSLSDHVLALPTQGQTHKWAPSRLGRCSLLSTQPSVASGAAPRVQGGS